MDKTLQKGNTNQGIDKELERIILSDLSSKSSENIPSEDITSFDSVISPAFIASINLMKQGLTNEELSDYLPKIKDGAQLGALLLLDYLHTNTPADRQDKIWANVSMLLQKGEKPVQEVLDYAIIELSNKMPKDERKRIFEAMSKVAESIKTDYSNLTKEEQKKKLEETFPFIGDINTRSAMHEKNERKALEERLLNDKAFANKLIAKRFMKNAVKDTAHNSKMLLAYTFAGMLPEKPREKIYEKLSMDSDQRLNSENISFITEFLSINAATTYWAVEAHKAGYSVAGPIIAGVITGIVGCVSRVNVCNNDSSHHGSPIFSIPYYLGKGVYEAGKAIVYKGPKSLVNHFKKSYDKAKQETLQELLNETKNEASNDGNK